MINPTFILQFLLVNSLKTTCILALTFVGLWMLRYSSASLRHWLLNISLMAVLALPVSTWLMPAWSLAILPQNVPPSTQSMNIARPFDVLQKFKYDIVNPDKPIVSSTVDVKKVSSNPKVMTRPSQPIPSKNMEMLNTFTPTLPGWILLLWCAGVIITLIRTIWQLIMIVCISHHSQPADHKWTTLLDSERRLLNVRRQITLQFSAQIHIPMTWGLWRPVILLPVEASEWDTERRRVVLLHELGHILRWDYLSQWGTVLVCSFNWFNPLVWKAVHHATVEREKSCDDLVLSTGIRGTDYARHLLDIAYSMITQKAFLVMGLEMAQRSGLEIRIRGILNTRQRRNTYPRLRALLLTTLLVLLIPLSGMHLDRAAAQTNSIVLSVAANDMGQDESLFKDFEAQHPGVQVKFVDAIRIPDVSDSLDEHFTAMESYANSADVLFIEGSNLSLTPFDTRAGYTLDMSPLINSDAQFPVDDFYPHMWTSFQWDNGIWGIPVAAEPILLSYNKASFDKANLAYPNGNWTLTDWSNAVSQLSQKDADGNVIASGFANSGRIFRESIWRSFMDSDVVDAGILPNAPQFDRADIRNVMEAYHQLELADDISSDPSTAAMFVDVVRRRPQDNYGWSLLPGNHMGTLPYGFAISAGTAHPDLAYELVKYLSAQPSLVIGIPARKSVLPTTALPTWLSDVIALSTTDPSTHNLNYANLRFTDYLNAAWGYISDFNASIESVMQAAETHITADLRTADSKHGHLTLAVTEPAVPVLAEGKIALNFAVVATRLPVADKQLWDQVIQDFTSSDPQVGIINLRMEGDFASTVASSSDCFYYPTNVVSTVSALLLPLDPLLSADSTFDRSDFIGNVLNASQYDGKTYALPLNIEPFVMRYSEDRFAAANLPAPSNTWQVEDFVNALEALKPDSQGQAPLVDGEGSGSYLLALIAAYGGLPLDFRTDPPTINFNDQASITAIQQVLDLIKNGYIHYTPLGNLDSSGVVAAVPNQTTAIYPTLLNSLGRKVPRDSTPDKAVLFPSGRTFNGLAYNLGSLYISVQSQNPEACYRWITTIAQHPELFQSMPVRSSQLNTAAFQAVTSPDVMALYKQVATLISDPNTIAFPTADQDTVSVSTFLPEHWLYEVFDDYVLNNGDLTTSLTNAETYAKVYQTCAAGLPPLDVGMVNNDEKNVLIPYVDCAEKADRRLKPVLDTLVGR